MTRLRACSCGGHPFRRSRRPRGHSRPTYRTFVRRFHHIPRTPRGAWRTASPMRACMRWASCGAHDRERRRPHQVPRLLRPEAGRHRPVPAVLLPPWRSGCSPWSRPIGSRASSPGSWHASPPCPRAWLPCRRDFRHDAAAAPLPHGRLHAVRFAGRRRGRAAPADVCTGRTGERLAGRHGRGIASTRH